MCHCETLLQYVIANESNTQRLTSLGVLVRSSTAWWTEWNILFVILSAMRKLLQPKQGSLFLWICEKTELDSWQVCSNSYSKSWQFFWLGEVWWESGSFTNKQTLFTRMLAITSLLLFVIPQTELGVQKLCATAIKAQIPNINPPALQWSFIYLIRKCSSGAEILLIPRKDLWQSFEFVRLIFFKDTQDCKAKAVDGKTSAIVAIDLQTLWLIVSVSYFHIKSWIQIDSLQNPLLICSPNLVFWPLFCRKLNKPFSFGLTKGSSCKRMVFLQSESGRLISLNSMKFNFFNKLSVLSCTSLPWQTNYNFWS